MSLLFNLYTWSAHWRVCSSQEGFSRVRRFVTPWTVAHQAPLSMGFSRQEYWSGLPCPPPGDLPEPGITFLPKPSAALQSDALCLTPREAAFTQTETFNTVRGSAENCLCTWWVAPGYFWIFIEESFTGLLIGEFYCIWWGRGKWKLLSCVWLLTTTRIIQSMEFSRAEYWSG